MSLQNIHFPYCTTCVLVYSYCLYSRCGSPRRAASSCFAALAAPVVSEPSPPPPALSVATLLRRPLCHLLLHNTLPPREGLFWLGPSRGGCLTTGSDPARACYRTAAPIHPAPPLHAHLVTVVAPSLLA